MIQIKNCDYLPYSSSKKARGVGVDQFGEIYAADHSNNRVMRWCKGTKEEAIVFAVATVEDNKRIRCVVS